MNTVRKHLSLVKGGELAELAHPATIILCLLSDVIGNKLDVIAFGATTIIKTALRKLDFLNNAKTLSDLTAQPGNRLEALKGDLKGKHSIRINDQFRIVFRFSDGEASEAEVTDYH